METIFDKIIRKEIPAGIVYEDEHVLAFYDIEPQAKVHVLVIPKKRAVSLSDLKANLKQWTSEEAGYFLTRVSEVASLLKLDKEGYRVVMNSGGHGGQTVPYLHAHILGGELLHTNFGAHKKREG